MSNNALTLYYMNKMVNKEEVKNPQTIAE